MPKKRKCMPNLKNNAKKSRNAIKIMQKKS